MRPTSTSDTQPQPKGATDIAKAEKDAHHCAFEAEIACVGLFRNRQEERTTPPAAGIQPGIERLQAAHFACWESCSPLLSRLRALHAGRLVDGWDGSFPSACEAVLSFAARVTTELMRLDVPGFADHFDLPKFYALLPPRAGHFRALVAQEFALLRAAAKKIMEPAGDIQEADGKAHEARHAGVDWDALLASAPLSASEIAERLGQPKRLVERTLRYHREKLCNGGCAVHEDAARDEPTFRYIMPKVLLTLQTWYAKRLKKAPK